ncbi:uncharacterized protein H6S33_000659 [Morchella sextelata]|uniref:uncharacterized protein n=1 Tax=Morchella sextelata TaxID=1174677 RepID=UPI001D0360A1|nr:uncharacterized protein H6S33_000659 [Morchella sextelata]KAH0615023.1 hypothetical protein H6S33_000659 [Morchella sextelata]
MESGSESDVQAFAAAPETVDPLIRAHILSLVSALGGITPTGYDLGDDALACLKDLRRWLRLYDEKLNRYDVARCMAEANLVNGDLVEILADWKEEDTENKTKHRLALACIEILVPLTWPLDKPLSEMTQNHHRHQPVLIHAQASYKSTILRHPSRKILSSVARVALPSVAIPATERTERDEGIIRLVLYFFRNIAMIEHPNPNESDTGEDINRCATIEAFNDQNVMHLLLAIASNMGGEFVTQDVVVMEAVYHLLKSVDIEQLFRTEEEERNKKAGSLTDLLKREDEMKRAAARSRSTRHNRFGTTVWMEKDDGRRAFVSGQGALLGKDTAQKKMDSSKKWKKPKGSDVKGVGRKTEFDLVVTLEGASKPQMRTFVEDFLDAGFNPLFSHVRRAIDRDAERLLNTNQRQFFYLVAWFLKAERARRKAAAKLQQQQPTADAAAVDAAAVDDSFSLVASVLNQEMLITLNRRMTEWYESKSWLELQSGMRCFTQILLTVQDMTASPLEEDQEIAENIQNRLFYEETTLDLIIGILRSYTKQPFSWLDDCTEMVHVHLKMLERYSKQHEHLFVRSKRQQKAKKKRQQDGIDMPADDNEEDDEELAMQSRNTMRERAFDFAKFEGKLLQQSCISTFLAFLDNYKELSYGQVKRAITFFHRIFVKRQEEVLLFRIDIVEQFYRIMQDPDGLPQGHPARKEMDQFVKYYLRKLIKKLESRPEMYVELLFTKVNSTMHYLTHGYDKEIRVRVPRPAAELHIPGLPRNEQIGVAVGALVNDNKGDAVDWLKDILNKAISERKSWEAEDAARRILEAEAAADAGAEVIESEAPKPPYITINPDTEERKTALFKDAKLRLLMTILELERLGVDDESPETPWIIPSSLTSENLKESFDLLKKYTNDPIVLDDGIAAEDLIKRKARPRLPAPDSEPDENENEEENEFVPGGPTEMNPLEPRKKPSKPRRRRRDPVEDESIMDLDALAAAEERLAARLQREKEKRVAIKSTLYVHDSDDELDPEQEMAFLMREKAQREGGPAGMETGGGASAALFSRLVAPTGTRKRKKGSGGSPEKRKKKRVVEESDATEEPDDEDDEDQGVISRDATPVVPGDETGSEEEEENGDSDDGTASPKGRGDVDMADAGDEDDDDEEEAPRPSASRARRGPVIVDSDSE